MAHGNGTRRPGAAPGQRLQSVHEQLKDLIESLREQRERRAREASPSPSVSSEPSPGESPSDAAPEVLDLEKRRLSSELAEAHSEVARLSAEEALLRRRVAEMEEEHRRLSDDYVAVEEQNSELASLFVALERLYASADRREALAAVQEIVVNMVGSEELGVYRLEASGGLELAHGFGLARARPDRFQAGDGTLSRVASRGALFVAGRGEDCEDPDLTAAIPLKSGGRVAGVLAIWRLLGHKPYLTDLDHRLFSVLESHAGRWLSPVAE
ncbi:MAG TPA: diguanylate phosphodiesterase [Anaeromyxobacteraceae bacterium]|nr:diguanylate phosphodiesterase [Anaeromyxobacteraceae bacterium]